MTAGLRGRAVHLSSIRYSAQGNDSSWPWSPTPSSPPYHYQSPPAQVQSSGSYFSRSFNSNVVVVMAVLLFALVVAAFINTMARCVLRRRRPQTAEDQAGREKGLDKSEIEALPVVAYGTDSFIHFNPAEGNECVVCLSEFMHGEKVRVLPDCHHGFHLTCIDTWLLTHTSCPVCRRSVLPAESCSASDDPSCAHSIAASSARFGSSRFGSARITSVDIEIEASGQSASATTSDHAATAGASTSRPKRSFASMLSAEAMANIIHGVGSRRFALRVQGPV